jgi:hypothetical protein
MLFKRKMDKKKKGIFKLMRGNIESLSLGFKLGISIGIHADQIHSICYIYL